MAKNTYTMLEPMKKKKKKDNDLPDLKNLMKSPQEGGWTEAETHRYLKSLGTKIDPITKKEIPITTLQELIKKEGPKKGEGHYYAPPKAHGGYVKKYARGGGVRKAR